MPRFDADTHDAYQLTDEEAIDIVRLFSAMRDDLESNPARLAVACQVLGRSKGAYTNPLALPLMTQFSAHEAGAFVDALRLPAEELEPLARALRPIVSVHGGRLLASWEAPLVLAASTAVLEALRRNPTPGVPKRRQRITTRALEALEYTTIGHEGGALDGDERREGLVAVLTFANLRRKRRSSLETLALAFGLTHAHVDRWVDAGPLAVAPERRR
jgi:hypothetical protein